MSVAWVSVDPLTPTVVQSTDSLAIQYNLSGSIMGVFRLLKIISIMVGRGILIIFSSNFQV